MRCEVCRSNLVPRSIVLPTTSLTPAIKAEVPATAEHGSVVYPWNNLFHWARYCCTAELAECESTPNMAIQPAWFAFVPVATAG